MDGALFRGKTRPKNLLRSMATTAIPMKNDEEEALDWSDVALSMVGGEHVTYADLLAAVARKTKKRTNA